MTASGPEEYGQEPWDDAPDGTTIGSVRIYVCSGGVTRPEGASDLGADDPVATVRAGLKAMD